MSNHHIVPLKIYLLIFSALLLGTVLTVAVAYVDMGYLNTPVAIIIAVGKASLVVLFFMHVKYSHKLVGLFAIAGFFWLVILLTMTMQDYYTRSWDPPTAAIKFLEDSVLK